MSVFVYPHMLSEENQGEKNPNEDKTYKSYHFKA